LGEGCGRSEYDGRGDAMMYIRRNSQVDGSSGTIMGRGKLPRMSCWLSEIMHKCNDRLLAWQRPAPCALAGETTRRAHVLYSCKKLTFALSPL
jgi:hypothetical protein